MTIDWATLGYNILTVFLLLLVISGAMPVITTLVLLTGPTLVKFNV